MALERFVHYIDETILTLALLTSMASRPRCVLAKQAIKFGEMQLHISNCAKPTVRNTGQKYNLTTILHILLTESECN